MSSPRERRQLPTPSHPAGTPTMRMTPPVRERRPPVGTARRRRANHAMLLSPMAQTAPAISLQIGRVPASTIRATGTPERRQPGWRAGQGTPASSPGGGFTPAPLRAAGREGVTPTASARTAWNADLRSARAGLRPAPGASVSGGVVLLLAHAPAAEGAGGRRSRACKSLRRVAWGRRRAPSPNCTFTTGGVCGPTR